MKYLKSKNGPIWHCRIDNFSQFRNLVDNEIPNIDNCVFRGQSDETWRLESTLDRLIHKARRTGAKQGSIKKFVALHLDRFKLEVRGRRGDNPPKLIGDDLWALGQHYGLATPLLDWSKSPYIGLFFSLVEIHENQVRRALWCLDREAVEQKNKYLKNQDPLQLIFPDTDDNKRLLGQSGLFSKGPVLKSVEAWIRQRFKKENRPILIKISLPGDHAFRKLTLKKLELMNLTYSTIFPDLIGASKYCNIKSENYEDDRV